MKIFGKFKKLGQRCSCHSVSLKRSIHGCFLRQLRLRHRRAIPLLLRACLRRLSPPLRHILASYSLMSFIFTPTVSRLSDRFGRRKILLFGLAVSSLSYFLFGSANVLWLLFLGECFREPQPLPFPRPSLRCRRHNPKPKAKILGAFGGSGRNSVYFWSCNRRHSKQPFWLRRAVFLASALAFTNLVLAYFRLPEPASFNIKRTVVFDSRKPCWKCF